MASWDAQFGRVISPGVVVDAVMPTYVLVVAGAVLRRLGVLRAEHDDAVMRLVLHVLCPCLILDKILGSVALHSAGGVMGSVALGFAIPVLTVALGWLIGALLGLAQGNGRRTFALSSGLQNYGYTAIPVVQELWKGGGAMAVLFVHNLGVELALWSAGVMLLSGKKEFEWRKLINGPVFAVVIGLLLVALGIDDAIVGAPRKAMSWLGSGAFPLALLIIGALMVDMLRVEKPSPKVIFGGILVRQVVSPLLILALAKWLPVQLELKQVLVVQAAMPSAMMPILMAKLYGGRPGIATQVVIATTVVSLLAVPYVVAWGCQWVGL